MQVTWLLTVISSQLRALGLLYFHAVRKRRTGFDLPDRAGAPAPASVRRGGLEHHTYA
jgi:hypothetical protein